MYTRSMAKQANAPLQAPSRMSTRMNADDSATVARPTEDTKNTGSSKIRPSSDTNSGQLSSRPSTHLDHTPSIVGSISEEIAMDVEGTKATSDGQSGANNLCPIDNSLVVCCSRCRIIYQKMADGLSPCPLCLRQTKHMSLYDTDVKQLRDSLSQASIQINALQKDLQSVKEMLAQHSAMLTPPTGTASAEKQVREFQTAEIRTLDNPLLEPTQTALSGDTTLLVSEKRGLSEAQGKIDALVLEFERSVRRIQELGSQAEVYLQKNSTKVGSAEHPLQACDALAIDSNNVSSDAQNVLFIGDSNVTRLYHDAKGMLRHNSRVTIRGCPEHKIFDTITSCHEWLQNAKGRLLIVIHSGLNDITALNKYGVDESTHLKQHFRAAISDISTKCQLVGADLMVCSIPEVIDFRRRLDFRSAAFDINSQIKSDAAEIGYKFIDTSPLESLGTHLMARDGLHYNKHGQFEVMKVIAAQIGTWLNMELDLTHSSSATYGGNRKLGYHAKEARNRPPVGVRTFRQISVPTSSRRSTSKTQGSYSDFSSRRDPVFRCSEYLARPPQHRETYANKSRNSFPIQLHCAPPHRYNQQNYVQHLNPWMPGAVPWS